MSLSDIAAGIEVVEKQHDQGVATIDDTGADLRTVLAEYEEALPCSPGEAATILKTYAAGGAIGTAGHEAGVAPVTAAKTLHLLGVDGLSPLSPMARRVVEDWLVGDIDRTTARELTDAPETEFALTAFVVTHDPIEGADAVCERVFADDSDAAVEKRDRLAGTLDGVGESF